MQQMKNKPAQQQTNNRRNSQADNLGAAGVPN